VSHSCEVTSCDCGSITSNPEVILSTQTVRASAVFATSECGELFLPTLRCQSRLLICLNLISDCSWLRKRCRSGPPALTHQSLANTGHEWCSLWHGEAVLGLSLRLTSLPLSIRNVARLWRKLWKPNRCPDFEPDANLNRIWANFILCHRRESPVVRLRLRIERVNNEEETPYRSPYR
jgi:hypothetical protein